MNQTNNNNQQTNRMNKESGMQFGEQSRPALLPYHEYIAMQRQNSGSPLTSTPLTSGNEGRGYSQPYYSSNKGGYNNSYYNNSSQNTPGYTLPPYSQYQRENYSHYYQYQQQPYNNYYYNNNQPQLPQTPTPYYQPQPPLAANQYNNNPAPQINTPSSIPLTSSSIQINHKQQQTKIKQQQSQMISKQNNEYGSISPEKKQQHIYKQQQSSNNNNNTINKPFYNENKSTYPQQSQRYQQDNYSSNDDWSEEQEQQEIIYQRYQNKKNNYHQQNKSKPINKKKDPVLDDPEQIKKWLQARKRNYPGPRKKALKENNNNQQQNAQSQMMNIAEKQQMSKLEYKIRKKLIIVNGDSRSIMKKIKNIDILRRIIQDPKILKRQRRNKIYQNPQKQQQKQQQHLIAPVQQPKIIPQEEIEVVQERVKVIQTENIQQLKVPHSPSSQSQDSIQPEQAPANKVPRQQQILLEREDITQKQGQIVEQKNILSIQPKHLFEYVDKKQLHITELKETPQQRRQTKGTLDPDMIIAHLKSKQEEDRESLNTLFDYKSNSHSYNYRVQTLQTSLKLDEIFAQTTYLLQAIRYIVKENFFDQL